MAIGRARLLPGWSLCAPAVQGSCLQPRRLRVARPPPRGAPQVLRVVCRWDFNPTLVAELLADLQVTRVACMAALVVAPTHTGTPQCHRVGGDGGPAPCKAVPSLQRPATQLAPPTASPWKLGRFSPLPPPPPPVPQIAIDWLTAHHIYTAEQIAQIEANVVKLQARATAIASKWRSLKSLNSRGKC